MHIVHLTSAHPRYDIRIFLKECRSLVKEHKVSFVVTDGKGDETKEGVYIYDVGSSKNRIHRVLKTVFSVYKKAVELDADAYHLHDPDLLLISNKLKNKGKIVVFDSHEDFSAEVSSKSYLNPMIAKFMPFLITVYENYFLKKLDMVVAATPFIRDKLKKINANSIDINNYAMLSEFYSEVIPFEQKKQVACYVGDLVKIRGIKEIVNAAFFCKKKDQGKIITIVGKFSEPELLDVVKKSSGYSCVNFVGQLSRSDVKNVLKESMIGLINFLPAPNHVASSPNKMYEYMSAGIPIIASNFPLWKEIIEGNRCGICVDPRSPEEIAKAIDYLLSNPDVSEEMGRNGRLAVESKYNWENESKKLLEIYKGFSR